MFELLKFIGKRILWLIPVLFGVSLLIFTIMYFAPGDPARQILGDGATVEAIEAKREELGLNDSFLTQYGRYMGNLLTGDLGTSYKTKRRWWRLWSRDIRIH